MLSSCRVVLVRPRIASNIGAVARVMANFGARELVLVAPEAEPNDERAVLLATHAQDILQGARIVADLDTALAECLMVIGTSARVGGLMRRQNVGTPEEILPKLWDVMQAGPVALVFGPEPSGLLNEEVTRCHHLVYIPTEEKAPALNLSHAVAICLYELRRAGSVSDRSGEDSGRSRSRLAEEKPAVFAEQEQMFAQLQASLEEVHFLYGDKAEPLMHALRHLLGRAQLTTMEVDLLHGLARQLKWIAAQRIT